jgi:hypothetical protein
MEEEEEAQVVVSNAHKAARARCPGPGMLENDCQTIGIGTSIIIDNLLNRVATEHGRVLGHQISADLI